MSSVFRSLAALVGFVLTSSLAQRGGLVLGMDADVDSNATGVGVVKLLASDGVSEGSVSSFGDYVELVGDFNVQDTNLENMTFYDSSDTFAETVSASEIVRNSEIYSTSESDRNYVKETTRNFTEISENEQLVSVDASVDKAGEKSGKVLSNSDNFTSGNQLKNGFEENPNVFFGSLENSPTTPSYTEENFTRSKAPLRFQKSFEIADEVPNSTEETLHYFHSTRNDSIERSTPTEELSSAPTTNEEAQDNPCSKSANPLVKQSTPNNPCHCTTTLTQERNESMILEDFRMQWPVDEWLSQGFFTEEYLLKIPVHWLSFPPPAPEAHYLLAVAYVVIMLVGTGGNLLVIFMFCRCKSLKTPANILVMNLAFSDMMMLLKMPIFIYNSFYLGPAMGEIGCQIYGFIGGLTGTVSIATLAAIGLDRYYVIVHPLDPLRKTTRLRARLCVAFVWLYGFTFAVLPLTELEFSRYVPEGYLTSCSFDYLNPSLRSRSFILLFFTAAWVVPFIVLTFSYLAICHVVVQAREVPPGGDSSRHCRENDKRRTELRLAEVVLGVVGLWFISWTPYAVVALLGVSGNQQLLTPLGSMVPALLAKMASAADPYVYAVNHPRFRLELVKSWHRIKGRPQFRASQGRSVAVTMHEPTEQSSHSSESDEFQLNVLQPQEQEPEAAGKPVDLPTARWNVGLLPPTWYRPPKPKRNRSTSLRLKSRVKDVHDKAVFYSYSEPRTEEKNDMD